MMRKNCILIFATALCFSAMGAQTKVSLDTVKRATIVFVGTVKELGATSFAEAPKSERMIVVRIDSIWKKPDMVSLKAGDFVTVEVKKIAEFHLGKQMTFYTDGWIFGSGVAVKELDHAIPTAAEATTTAGADQFARTQREADDQDLAERINSADLVVSGRVTQLRAVTGTASANRPPVSEHDPEWQEAVVEVSSLLKGQEGTQIVVRFAGSTDIAWYQCPKLKVGQTGTFVMKKDDVTGVGPAVLGRKESTAYVVLRPENLLPISDAPRVRSLLQK